MDLSAKGFEMFFKPWQVDALKYLITIRPNGANSREVFFHVSNNLEISRASIINFLNQMVDDGVLEYTETTGKGGRKSGTRQEAPGEPSSPARSSSGSGRVTSPHMRSPYRSRSWSRPTGTFM